MTRRESANGQLTVYLGMAAGVGKSVRNVAGIVQRLQEAKGFDVLIADFDLERESS